MAARSAPKAAAEFGKRLRARRNALELSQFDVAERSGLHWTYVGSVERGERNVGLQNILKLAGAVDTDASELVAGLKP